MAIALRNIFFAVIQILFFTSASMMDNKTLEENNDTIEKEIRKLFAQHRIFLESRLRNDELLCKCTGDGCDKEIINIAGPKYKGICRAHYLGQCLRMFTIDHDGIINEPILSCLRKEELYPIDRPFSCQTVNTTQVIHIANCCKNKSFCNEEKLPIELGIWPRSGENNTIHWYILLLLAVAVIFSGIGLCVGIFYCNLDRIKTHFNRAVQPVLQVHFISNRSRRYRSNSRLEKLLDDLERTVSTGSGAGMPMLAQRTIARQITLHECIGRGRFGEVYVGEWRGEKVAVKIFLSRDELSWQRETDIYRHNMIRHCNLLRWIASDNKDTGTSTQLWLVTEYLPNGSLYDYLEANKLNLITTIQFVRSIASGLAYLHTELPGVKNQCHKPGIAHRDIKSKNILVKNDMTCCIADLGMAIRYINGEIDFPQQNRGGTVRYLAPEFLLNTFNDSSFTAYLQMDIYAFALVIWEICRRAESTTDNLNALPYEVPYYEFVVREPTLDEMLNVHREGCRPNIPSDWHKCRILAELIRIMTESWSASPNSRLTALNIRCSLDRFCASQNLSIVT